MNEDEEKFREKIQKISITVFSITYLIFYIIGSILI